MAGTAYTTAGSGLFTPGASDTGTIDAALKVVYPSKAVEAMVNVERPFTQKMKRSLPPGGKVSEGLVTFGMILNTPQAVNVIPDGGPFPGARNRSPLQGTLRPSIFAGTMSIGLITKAIADSAKSAFNGGEYRGRIEETIADLGKFIEQTYVGTYPGSVTLATQVGNLRAVVESSASTTTFICELPRGTQYIKENMYITMVYDNSGTETIRTGGGSNLVTKVDHDTRTVTVTNAITSITATDRCFVGNANTGAAAETLFTEVNGLPGLVDNGVNQTSVHGNSRTTYPKLKSNVIDKGVLTPLTEQLLIQAAYKNRSISGKRITDAWAAPGQAMKWVEFVAEQRRFPTPSGTQNKTTGFTEEELVHVFPGGQFRLNISYDVIPREMYLLNWDTFFLYQALEMQWLNEAQRLMLIPRAGGHNAGYLAYLVSVENWGCDMPIANTVIRNLKDPYIGDA